MHDLTQFPRKLDETYAEFAHQGFPPKMDKLAMERTSIDYMVVYPTAALLTTAVPDLPADTAAAYRRADNNWLHDCCVAAGGRVLGAAAVDLRDAEEAAREAHCCVKEFDFKAIYINPVPPIMVRRFAGAD
ncbi:MAG: amidohydrolase family protein [Candidatus Binatia bacterium]